MRRIAASLGGMSAFQRVIVAFPVIVSLLCSGAVAARGRQTSAPQIEAQPRAPIDEGQHAPHIQWCSEGTRVWIEYRRTSVGQRRGQKEQQPAQRGVYLAVAQPRSADAARLPDRGQIDAPP